MGKPKRKFNVNEESPDNITQIAKKKFHIHDLTSISPKNERQKQFFKEVENDTPMVMLAGHAGTGKTFIALWSALYQVFDPSTPYDKVLIVRSAVESRKIGFLPGNIEEKSEAYEDPYKQVVSQVVKYKTAYDNLKALGLLEFKLTSHLRGTTFDNTIVVVDECQNADADELVTICTRIGYNSKIILCGDGNQDDLARQREKSGMGYIEKVMLNLPYGDAPVIRFTLDDIVRSGFVRNFLIAASKVPKE